uniref:Secreted protein n=1 Tax=Manihot esculenta TaxID=3983 RepID=A0A2C9UWA6_MANES
MLIKHVQILLLAIFFFHNVSCFWSLSIGHKINGKAEVNFCNWNSLFQRNQNCYPNRKALLGPRTETPEASLSSPFPTLQSTETGDSAWLTGLLQFF